MEDIYNLNYDCIQDLHFGLFHLCVHILPITFEFYKRIQSITALKIIKSYEKSTNLLRNFKNLTSLVDLRFGYQYGLKFEHNCLINLLHLHCKLIHPTDSIYLTKLTHLKCRIERLECIKNLTNLKILGIHGYWNILCDIDQNNFIYLQDISVYMESYTNRNKWNGNIEQELNFRFPYLTSLSFAAKISSRIDNSKFINLDNQTNLISLKLEFVKLAHIRYYLATNTNLTKLIFTYSWQNIELSHERHYKLKHLKLFFAGHVVLHSMTQLKIKDIISCQSLTEI